jgi:hypothetical protein
MCRHQSTDMKKTLDIVPNYNIISVIGLVEN